MAKKATRKKVTAPKKPKFTRILSIDGGGIRGIIPGVSTGEAAGTAAAMAVRAGISPREVDVPTLRQKLKDQGVILDLAS